ncbi:MAG TPA: hypothetical protein DEV97_06370 [Lachnospiraceae bacterium]|nr:hypothetical protein [Lachnospiraceae bacterium]
MRNNMLYNDDPFNLDLDDDEYKSEEKRAEFVLAIIGTADSDAGTATLILDGMTSAMQKQYKVLSSAWPLASGDRVVVMKMSGTYVVIGKFGTAEDPDPDPDPDPPTDILPVEKGGTGVSGIVMETTAANIFTPKSGITINNASFVSWGKIAQLHVNFSPSTSSTFIILGTVLSGKRPKIISFGGATGTSGGTAVVYTDGNTYVYGSYTAGSNYSMGLTYLLP